MPYLPESLRNAVIPVYNLRCSLFLHASCWRHLLLPHPHRESFARSYSRRQKKCTRLDLCITPWEVNIFSRYKWWSGSVAYAVYYYKHIVYNRSWFAYATAVTAHPPFSTLVKANSAEPRCTPLESRQKLVSNQYIKHAERLGCWGAMSCAICAFRLYFPRLTPKIAYFAVSYAQYLPSSLTVLHV